MKLFLYVIGSLAGLLLFKNEQPELAIFSAIWISFAIGMIK